MTAFNRDHAIASATAHQNAGRFAEAEKIYLHILAANPNDYQTLCSLSTVFLSTQRADAAMGACYKALSINSQCIEALSNLGSALGMRGQYEEALECLRRAAVFAPHVAAIHNNLGLALARVGRHEDAICVFHRALATTPHVAMLNNSLGVSLREVGRLEEAAVAHQRAAALRPNLLDAHNNLGAVLTDLGLLQDAVAALHRALQIQPDYARAHNNLGSALAALGDHDRALQHMRRAVELDPHLAGAHFNLSQQLLLLGEWREGFQEYEWRWRISGAPAMREYGVPIFPGGDPRDKTILLHAEQGFGDVLNFIRYAELLHRAGTHVILECQPSLTRLLASCSYLDQVIPFGGAFGKIDFHLPLASLPLLFASTPENVPNKTPYIRAIASDIERWKSRVAASGTRRKIGLAWSGSALRMKYRNRAISLSMLAPLARVDADFYSLQLGDAGKEKSPEGMNLIDFTADLTDFAQTAALMANLDCIVTIDTSIAHLAGAMGLNTFIMLPRVADWRWLRDREDSPWYLSVRLIRQRAIGDWTQVIDRVARELSR